MTDPSLYRDDSRVRHMLDALEQIAELRKGLSREQLRWHEGITERILFNLMILGEAANNITREFAAMNPDVDWKGIAGVLLTRCRQSRRSRLRTWGISCK